MCSMDYSVTPIGRSKYAKYEEMKRHEQLLLGATDKQLEQMAKYQARSEEAKKGASTIKKGAMATVGADVFVNGTTKGVDLANKVTKTATRAGGWTGAIAALSGYDVLMKKVTDNSDSVKEASLKHPIATAILYLTGGVATLTGANSLYNYAKKEISKKYPKDIEKIETKLNGFKEALNKTWVNKEIVKPINELSAKIATSAPTISKAAKTALPYAPVGIMSYTFVKGLGTALKTEKEEAQKLKELKTAQESALLRHSLNKIAELDKKTDMLYYAAPMAMSSQAANVQELPMPESEFFDEYNNDFDSDNWDNKE